MACAGSSLKISAKLKSTYKVSIFKLDTSFMIQANLI